MAIRRYYGLVYKHQAGVEVRAPRLARGKAKLSLAQVVKLVNTLASGANARKGLGVQVSPWALCLFSHYN